MVMFRVGGWHIREDNKLQQLKVIARSEPGLYIVAEIVGEADEASTQRYPSSSLHPLTINLFTEPPLSVCVSTPLQVHNLKCSFHLTSPTSRVSSTKRLELQCHLHLPSQFQCQLCVRLKL